MPSAWPGFQSTWTSSSSAAGMQFSQSSPIDFAGPEFALSAGSLEQNNSNPGGGGAFRRPILGQKRNSVSAGLGDLAKPSAFTELQVSNKNANSTVNGKRICMGYEYRNQEEEGSNRADVQAFGFPPNFIQFQGLSSTARNSGNRGFPTGSFCTFPSVQSRSINGDRSDLPMAIQDEDGNPLQQQQVGVLDADKSYQDSYVQFFGPYVRQFSTENQDSQMSEGDSQEMMVDEIPPSPPLGPSTSTGYSGLRRAAVPSPETCRQYLRTGSYSPRQVFEFCRPNSCAYPYHSDIY